MKTNTKTKKVAGGKKVKVKAWAKVFIGGVLESTGGRLHISFNEKYLNLYKNSPDSIIIPVEITYTLPPSRGEKL